MFLVLASLAHKSAVGDFQSGTARFDYVGGWFPAGSGMAVLEGLHQFRQINSPKRTPAPAIARHLGWLIGWLALLGQGGAAGCAADYFDHHHLGKVRAQADHRPLPPRAPTSAANVRSKAPEVPEGLHQFSQINNLRWLT
jgi:hypothetical protein